MSEESTIGLHAHPVSHEISINQMQLSWASSAGMMGAMGIPSALFWLDPSLNSMLSPLATEVGHDMFRLLVAWSSSQGTKEDYEAMVTVFADNFAEGFLAWGAAVGAAGGGGFELRGDRKKLSGRYELNARLLACPPYPRGVPV